MSNCVLFQDTFKVDKLDPDGKKFDKVSRVKAESEEMAMLLDVNTEIYPIHAGERYAVVLATTLNKDGTPDTGYYTQAGRKTLADEYEYVMHGKLYKISDEGKAPNVKTEVYISFGGLLMLLKGAHASFDNFELDQRLFLLMRRVLEQ